MKALEEINLDGYKIVRSEMFSHLPRKTDATCTIWPYKIAFSKVALVALNDCDFIRMQVNPSNKCLIIAPTTSSDVNCIRWTKGTKERLVKHMESAAFGTDLYRSWGLDPEYNYRATGRLVTANKKVMMLFDFNDPEIWRSKKDGADSE